MVTKTRCPRPAGNRGAYSLTGQPLENQDDECYYDYDLDALKPEPEAPIPDVTEGLMSVPESIPSPVGMAESILVESDDLSAWYDEQAADDNLG